MKLKSTVRLALFASIFGGVAVARAAPHKPRRDALFFTGELAPDQSSGSCAALKTLDFTSRGIETGRHCISSKVRNGDAVFATSSCTFTRASQQWRRSAAMEISMHANERLHVATLRLAEHLEQHPSEEQNVCVYTGFVVKKESTKQ